MKIVESDYCVRDDRRPYFLGNNFSTVGVTVSYAIQQTMKLCAGIKCVPLPSNKRRPLRDLLI